jgi:hypothetical protein
VNATRGCTASPIIRLTNLTIVLLASTPSASFVGILGVEVDRMSVNSWSGVRSPAAAP